MCTRIGSSSGNLYTNKSSKAVISQNTQLTNTTKSTNPVQQVAKSNYSGAGYKSAGFEGVSGRLGISAGLAAKTEAKVSTGDKFVDSLINASAKEKKTPEYYTKVSQALADPSKRALLIKHFGLNSPKNIEALKVGVFMEGGQGFNRQNMMVTGEVMLNRAIAMSLAKGRPVSIAEVLKKPNQFAVNDKATMTKEGLKTFNEVMALKKGTQYQNAMNPNVSSVVDSLVSGQRGESGAIHYGFKGKNGVNRTDTPTTDYYTVRSW
ncbi:MAG: hypothetical protein U0354_16290 [Candidatus Sericytochromatia bacterium]